jgi:hypothetical protein
MKLKHIIIVSLILAIFAIGAVSASEDVASDDNLTVVDEIDDSVSEVDDSVSNEADDSLAAVDDSSPEVDDSLGDGKKDIVNSGNIYVTVNDGYRLDDEDGILVFTSEDSEATGSLLIYVAGEDRPRLEKNIDYRDYGGSGVCNINIRPYQLKLNAEGSYLVKVTFRGVPLFDGYIDILPYKFWCTDEWGNDLFDGYYGYGNTINAYIYLPSDAQGKLEFTINGKTYNVEHNYGLGKVSINTEGWALKDYKVIAQFTPKDDSKYLKRIIDDDVSIRPDVSHPEVMAIKENAALTVSAPSNVKGSVNITVYQWVDGNPKPIDTKMLTLTNGRVSIPLSTFKEGAYDFKIDYKIGIYTYSWDGSIENPAGEYDLLVLKNSREISANFYPSTITEGDSANLIITGPKLKLTDVELYVDDEFVKIVSLKNGIIDEKITGLSKGTHKIKVFLYQLEEDNHVYFYSNTFTVKVNAKPQVITPVATKFVASKATFKAKTATKKYSVTLKTNANKAVKGVTVNIKINGKTYSAKTDSNGKATFKITKFKKKGTFTATISFKGDKNYKKSSKSVKIKIK